MLIGVLPDDPPQFTPSQADGAAKLGGQAAGDGVGAAVGAALGAAVGLTGPGVGVGADSLFPQKDEEGAQLQAHIKPENKAPRKNKIVNPGIEYNFLLDL